jgi:hypothetical protein
MQLAIPLRKMTIAEKLRAIEEIWADLQQSAEEIPSPVWHADVLRAREDRVREGTSHFGDWSDARRRIRDRTR